MPHLVVIYGPPLSGKSSVARELARSMPEKTALVSVDDLLRQSIVIPDRDAVAELEMVHTQARLLVANYLKNGYHVVLEGAFAYGGEGGVQRYEQEIDQTVALMRNLARAALLVRLGATEDTLLSRHEAAGRSSGFEAALRIDATYRPRYGGRSLRIEVDALSAVEAAEQIRQRLEDGDIA